MSYINLIYDDSLSCIVICDFMVSYLGLLGFSSKLGDIFYIEISSR